MKIKGISPIEQHVEKLVLIVFALFAMAMFVLQFNIFGDPNAVQIDPNRKVSPAQAVEAISDMARRKEGEIDAVAGAEVPTPPGPLDRFNEAARTPAVPPTYSTVALFPGASGSTTIDPTDVRPDGAVAESVLEITIPGTTAPFARAFGATINPLVPASQPEFAALLPAEQPLDIRAVSIQATFPAAELRAALAEIPDQESIRSLPLSWWVDQVEILDIEVARDRLGVDGSVVDTAILPPVPGVASLRARIFAADVAPRDLPAILADERSNREKIRRAPFPDSIAGAPWIWPALAAERDAADPNRVAVQRLVDERRRLMAEIERLKKPRPGQGRDEERVPPPPGQGGGPRPGGGPGSGGSSSGASTAANVAKRIEELFKRATDIETRLREEFQRNADGDALSKIDEAIFVEAVESITARNASAAVTVWTHDLHPEPGQIYQYRVRVWITNPLFGHADQIGADQRSAASALAIASPWSDPTAIIAVEPSPAAFVASASTGEGLGGLELRRAASASLDVFAFHYGYWRGTDITLSPGDQLRADIPIPALPQFEIVAEDGSTPSVGETTMGAEVLPISREVYLVGVVPPASGSGDLVFLTRPDGSVEVRRAGPDAESDAAARLRDSEAKGRKAKVADPTATVRGR